jgi:hypothetical protein
MVPRKRIESRIIDPGLGIEWALDTRKSKTWGLALPLLARQLTKLIGWEIYIIFLFSGQSKDI